jgi:formate dehydrogenase assembly factor FdhD
MTKPLWRANAIRMNTISFVFKDSKKFLGRWNVDYCQRVLHSKIRMANEDHCGTCGNTRISEQLKKNQAKTIKQFKANTDAMRRYNEYINVAIRSRTLVPKIDTMERQIEYYICMN